MAEFKEIKTQQEFDEAISERLKREQAKFADYEDLKKRAGEAEGLRKQLETATAKISDLEKTAKESADKLAGHAKEVADLTERAAKAEHSLLRRRIAEENHIPTTLADRLSGETEEELRKDAKTLSQYVKTEAAPLATVDPAPSGEQEARNTALRGVLQGLNLSGGN